MDNLKKYGSMLKNLHPNKLKELVNKLNKRTKTTQDAIKKLRIKK